MRKQGLPFDTAMRSDSQDTQRLADQQRFVHDGRSHDKPDLLHIFGLVSSLIEHCAINSLAKPRQAP
jgi:hypothetical protein